MKLKNKAIISIMLCMVLVFCSCGIEPPAKPNKYKLDAGKLESELEGIIGDSQHPLTSISAAIVKDGKIEYCGGVGYRYIDSKNPNNSKIADGATKYRVSSISELVTAIGFMQLAEQGKVDLDRDISDYLGFDFRNPNYKDTPITARMLLSHTSSVRDNKGTFLPLHEDIRELFIKNGRYYNKGANWSKAEGGIKQEPGGYFKQADLNFGIIAAVIEKVSGERFDEYMATHVFEPMKLTCSYNVSNMDEASRQNLAVLYRKLTQGKYDVLGTWEPQADDYSDKFPKKDSVMIKNPNINMGFKEESLAGYKIGSNPTVFSPHGGLRASASDLATIMLMLMNDGKYNDEQILKPSSIEEMFSPVWVYNEKKKNGDTQNGRITCFGLGSQIMKSADGDRILKDKDIKMSGRFGDENGLLGGMMMDRDFKNGFVYLTGGMGSNPNEYRGEYSAFNKWEEKIMTSIFKFSGFAY